MSIMNITAHSHDVKYLHRKINFNTSNPPFISNKTQPRCSVLFDKRNFFDIIFNSDHQIQYDHEIGVLKMIIQNKLALVLFENFNHERRGTLQGSYFDLYGSYGSLIANCDF